MDELVVATIVDVQPHPGARAPSFLLSLDLGARGTHEAVLPTGEYEPAELEGMQIVCRVEAEGPVIAGAHSHGRGFVLVRPVDKVEPGSLVA